jgi:uncharacterized membrane protein
LFAHLLKLAYAGGRVLKENQRGWELSVRGARREVRELLEESPSLRRRIVDLIHHAFQDDRDAALGALNLPDEAITEDPPWRFEQVMDDDFIPSPQTRE